MHVWSLRFRGVLHSSVLSSHRHATLNEYEPQAYIQCVLGPENFVKPVLPTHGLHGSSPLLQSSFSTAPPTSLNLWVTVPGPPWPPLICRALGLKRAFTQLDLVGSFLCSDETTENRVPGEAVAVRKQGGPRLGEDPLQNYSPHPHGDSRDSSRRENSFSIEPCLTALRIQIFPRRSTPVHYCLLPCCEQARKLCCKRSPGRGLGTGENLKRKRGSS